MPTPFDIAKHINEKSALEFDNKDYNAYMMNRIMSNHMSTIFFAEVMNKLRDLPADIQYAFYYYGIPQGKRYGKWHKADINKDVDLIMSYYNVNRTIGEQYLKLFTKDDLEQLKEKMVEGGRK